FRSMEAYFYNGSVGTELEAGIPYWMWVVLPKMFPEYLPGPGGYNALGLFNVPGQDIPAGFSKKTIGFERVGVNCALCHAESIRLSENEPPMYLPAGASTTVDVLGYQNFLFACASDPRCNSDMEPIWNLRPRQGLALHWDGLNNTITEVIRSSALGDGATPKNIPLQQLQSLQDWLMDLKPPKYPSNRFPINAKLAATGHTI